MSPKVICWLAYMLGTVGSWLWQWGKWKKPGNQWMEFWKELGPKHIMSNVVLDQILFGIWDLGILDKPADMIGHHVLPVEKWGLIHGGDQKMPQTAIALGFFGDMFMDQVVYFVRARGRAVMARFSKPAAPPPPTEPTPEEAVP